MPDIEDLRDKMDEVTLEMVRLLKKRTDIAKSIGEAKRDSKRGITDEAREGILRGKVASLCREMGLDEAMAAKFLNFLINESVMVQSAHRRTHLSVFLRARQMEQEGKRIIHMEVGEPDFAPPQTLKESLAEAIDSGHTRYGPARGTPAFCSALARHASAKFGCDVSEKNITVTPGARFAVYAAVTTLLNPGDEIIVIEPAWPAYRDCALNAGVKVRTVGTTLEGGWEPNPQEIRDAIGPNTKMLVLNYPNNPTGKVLPHALQDEIMQIAQDSSLYVLSDEIYSEYAENWKSVLTYGYKKSIVTQSFSKSHAMTGFRIGYAISDEQIIKRISRLAALCLTSVAEPIQHAAMGALGADTSDNASTVRNRLDTLVQKAQNMGLDFVAPDGAMYLFAKTGMDGTELAERALERGLAIAPGEGFGNYMGFVRISACQDEKTLIEGMDTLDSIMRDEK